jgi:hypothetical protein
VSLRDTLLQLGYVLIALGAVFATWALLSGPLGRLTGFGDHDDRERAKRGASEISMDDRERATRGASDISMDDATPEPADDRRTGSSEAPT